VISHAFRVAGRLTQQGFQNKSRRRLRNRRGDMMEGPANREPIACNSQWLARKEIPVSAFA